MKTEKGVLSSRRAGNLFFAMTVVQIVGSFSYGIAGLFFPQLYGITISTVFSEGLALVPMLVLQPAPVWRREHCFRSAGSGRFRFCRHCC